MYRRGGQDDHDSMYQDDHHDDHHDDHIMKEEQHAMKAMGQAKVDYWGGYYDFLINEGSYKFWAVFQVSFAMRFLPHKLHPPTKYTSMTRNRKLVDF